MQSCREATGYFCQERAVTGAAVDEEIFQNGLSAEEVIGPGDDQGTD